MRIVRAHAALTMLVVTFAITWAVWIPRALASHSLIEERWPIVLGSVWSYGPLLAAILAAAMCGGRAGLRQLVQRVTHGRIGWSPYLIALLAPAAFWLLIAGSAWVAGQPWEAVRPRALAVSPLQAVALLAALLATDGLGEEVGWRGFALPTLLLRWRLLSASFMIGVAWMAWHLPLLVTQGSALAGSPLLFHLVDLPLTAIFYTWLFLRSDGSTLPAIILHGSASVWTSLAVPAGPWNLLALVLVAKLALALVIASRWRSAVTPPPPERVSAVVPTQVHHLDPAE
jgi:hypothetical protein